MNIRTHGGDIFGVEKEYAIPRGTLIDFSVNLNPLGPPPSLRAAISASIDDVALYPDNEYRECRANIAAYHSIPPEWVTAGNGATELLFLFCRTVKVPRALVVAPAFSEYLRALAAAGTAVSYFELTAADNFMLNFDDLRNELRKGYSLLVIGSPNNPTGTLLSQDEIALLSRECLLTGCRILLDESFIEFVSDGSGGFTGIDSMMPENIFVVRSLTKIFSIPGLRLGYGVSRDAVLNRALALQKEPWSVNIFASRCAEFLLTESDYLRETRHAVAGENLSLSGDLRRFAWLHVFPSPVNYLLVKIINGFSSSYLADALLRHSILIRDASNFKFLDAQFARIAVKDRESNSKLIRALTDISASFPERGDEKNLYKVTL